MDSISYDLILGHISTICAWIGPGIMDIGVNIVLTIVLLAPIFFLAIRRALPSLRCVRCGRTLSFSDDLAVESLKSILLSSAFFPGPRRTCFACRHLDNPIPQ